MKEARYFLEALILISLPLLVFSNSLHLTVILFAVAFGLSTFELYNMSGNSKATAFGLTSLTAALTLPLLFSIDLDIYKYVCLLASGLIFYMSYLTLDDKNISDFISKNPMGVFMMVMVIVFSCSYILTVTNWFYYIVFGFYLSVMGDAGGKVFGKFFGKRKLAPTISPNKTIEGFFGGLVMTLIFGFVCYYMFFGYLNINNIMSITVLSVTGPLGDLVNSKVKRGFGVKDSGDIFRGHGGIWDCMDSHIFTISTVSFFASTGML